MPIKKGTALIVDGYNVIHSWPEMIELKADSLAAARQALIDVMINYAAYRDTKTYIVFDGQGDEETTEKIGGITVCYTREADTADSYIERLVGDETLSHLAIYVATSDYTEQRIILGRGAHRMSSRELHLEVQKMWVSFDRFQRKKGDTSGLLASRLGDEVRAALEKLRRGK